MTPPYNCITNVLATADVDTWFPSTVIPVVADDTARDAMFPSPTTDQRIQNLGAGEYQRYDGSDWIPDIPTDPSIVLGEDRTVVDMPSYLRNNSVGNVLDYGACGDGVTDDSAAFANALNVHESIYVPRGKRFLINNVQLPSNVHVFGGGSVLAAPGADNRAFLVIGDKVVIRNILFDGNLGAGINKTDIKCADGSGDLLVEGCVFKSGHYSAIMGRDDPSGGTEPVYNAPVKGITVVGCLIYGYTRPFHLFSINNFLLSNSTVRDCRADAIRLRDAIGSCQILGNKFYNIGNGTWDDQTRDVVDALWSGKEFIFANNYVDTVAQIGLDLKPYYYPGIPDQTPDGSPSPDKIIVSNNIFKKCRGQGISIMGSADIDGEGTPYRLHCVIVSSNIITEGNQEDSSLSRAGIEVRRLGAYVNISSNIVFANAAHGIQVYSNQATDLPNKSVVVSDNMCVNNKGWGIYAAGVDGCIISRNICEYDSLLTGYAQLQGIVVNSVDGSHTPIRTSIISENICRNNSVGQISFSGSGTRINNIAASRDNIIDGPQSPNIAWAAQRRVLHSTSTPVSTDGAFRIGDIVFNSAPTSNGVSHWVCINDGAPGTWQPVYLNQQVPAVLTGSGILTAGSTTVLDTNIQTGDVVILSRTSQGSSPGVLSYGNIVNGTSFDVTSSEGSDDGTFAYQIIKP